MTPPRSRPSGRMALRPASSRPSSVPARRPSPPWPSAPPRRSPRRRVTGRCSSSTSRPGRSSGALPFPEGDVFAAKFSRDGRSLLVAGGEGAESGRAVVFETRTWSRVATLGDELDAVLAADLSPDGTRVVLGGPTRVVKVLAGHGGEVVHTFRKPTDWVTAAGFSPDGLLVAAGDRFGGLFLWENQSGREFLTLRGHTKAITAIAWIAGADRLVTAGEDGAIQLWDLHTGKVASRWEAHAGGVLAVDVHPSGRIASAGRDRRVKVWEADGRPVSDFGPTSDHATRVAWTADGGSLVSGDWSGELLLWELAGSTLALLPTPVAARHAAPTLVEPVLTPARSDIPKPTVADRAAAGQVGDDLDVALASARDAAAAAERAAERLARLAKARGRSPRGTGSGGSPRTSAGDGLAAANAALASLRAARAADPGNPHIARAIEETERAIRLLESAGDRRSAPR